MLGKKLDQLMATLHSLTDFEFESPSQDEGPLAVVPHTMTFWFHQVKDDHCFPLCSFLVEQSMLYGIPINQLYSFSIYKALFFHIIIREYGIFDTSRIFFHTHYASVRGMFDYFSEKHSSHFHLYGRDPSLDKD